MTYSKLWNAQGVTACLLLWGGVGCATLHPPQMTVLEDTTALGCAWNATQMHWYYVPEVEGAPARNGPIHEIAQCTQLGQPIECRWACPP